jgi:hypothetical protein
MHTGSGTARRPGFRLALRAYGSGVHVLDVDDRMIEREGYPDLADFAQERVVWATPADLRTVSERDRVLIEVADAAAQAG